MPLVFTPKDNLGQAMILLTLMIPLLGMFMGLAVDAGLAYVIRGRLARTVDAAALAGAKAMQCQTTTTHL